MFTLPTATYSNRGTTIDAVDGALRRSRSCDKAEPREGKSSSFLRRRRSIPSRRTAVIDAIPCPILAAFAAALIGLSGEPAHAKLLKSLPSGAARRREIAVAK